MNSKNLFMNGEAFVIHWRSTLGKHMPQHQGLGLLSIPRALWGCVKETCLALLTSINPSERTWFISTFALHLSCASTRDRLPVRSLSNSHFKGGIIANKLVLCLMIDMTS